MVVLYFRYSIMKCITFATQTRSLGALSLVAQGTVDARALQPSPEPLAHGPRQSPAPLKRPAHADVKEPRVKPSHPDTVAELHWTPGVLLQAEIKAALVAMGAAAAMYEKWESEFEQMDLDGDGKLTKDEFVGSACKPCIMMALDANRDGVLDLDELLHHEDDAASFGSVLHWLVGDAELMFSSGDADVVRGALQTRAQSDEPSDRQIDRL